MGDQGSEGNGTTNRRVSTLPGEVSLCRVRSEKSAEPILTGDNELLRDMEFSRPSKVVNIELRPDLDRKIAYA
ncbi:MAG: hypothetical protein Tsb0034_04970 [Ekhidna sp.]